MQTTTISTPPRFHFAIYTVRQKISIKPQSNYRTIIETASFDVAMEYFREAKRKNPSRAAHISRQLYKATKYDLVSTEIYSEQQQPTQASLPLE